MTDKQNYFIYIDNTSDNNDKIMENLHKQINYEQNSVIIDGVDVSGCEHFEDEECLNPSETVANCEASPNCNYKQLKRKEQECERLKNTVMQKCPQCGEVYLNPIGCELYEQLDQLKAENEELTKYKSLFEKTRNLYNEARMNNYELLDEIKDLKDSIKRTICQSECYRYKEAEKLSQTLTEIKEIAEEKANVNDWLALEILQKISECEAKNGI